MVCTMRRLPICILLIVLVTEPARAVYDDQWPDAKLVLQQFDVFADGDALLVPVTIRGQDYPFMLDTGTDGILYDTSPGHVLGQRIETALRITSPGGLEKKIDSYPNPGATLGNIRLSTDEKVFGTDLTRLRQAIGHEIRGIIGMSFLKAHVVYLDPDAQKIFFLKSAGQSRTEPLRIEYLRKFVVGEIGPCIEAEIAGFGKKKFLIDMGLGLNQA